MLGCPLVGQRAFDVLDRFAFEATKPDGIKRLAQRRSIELEAVARSHGEVPHAPGRMSQHGPRQVDAASISR